MSKFLEFKNKNDELNALINSDAGEIVTGLMEETIKSIPNASVLVLSGYVPSFNDGDACEFSLNVEVGSEAWDLIIEEDDYELIKEIVKFDGAEDEFDIDDFEDFELDPKVNIDWHDLYHIFDDYEYLLQKVYGDSFRLIVQLQDNGNVIITEKSYDCGY